MGTTMRILKILGECGRMSDMKDVVVVVPNIRSVHNVASIFRTADGAGVRKIYLCGITPTPFDRLGNVRQDFQKVALGAHESVLWEQRELCEEVLDTLKKEGYTVCALEQSEKSIPYDSKIHRDKIALVLGEEVSGIEQDILSQVDIILEIPMQGEKESLNVSVAFGIAIYAIMK